MNQDQFLNHILPLQPRLQLVAEHLLGSATEAEDAVQDVVATLWERRSELDRLLNVEGYAMNALRNHCPKGLIEDFTLVNEDYTRLMLFSLFK